MRALRCSINVTLDGCCHHEAGLPLDEESTRHWTSEVGRADALLIDEYELVVQPVLAGHGPTSRAAVPAGAMSGSTRSVC